MKFDDILGTIPTLTQQQLKTLRVTIDSFIKQPPENDDIVLFYECAVKTLNIGIPYSEFQKTTTFKMWRRHAPKCVSFVEETWPESINSRVIKKALFNFLTEILRDNLRARDIPVTIGTFSANLVSMFEAFEKEFPDYRQSGLAHVILKNMKRGARGE